MRKATTSSTCAAVKIDLPTNSGRTRTETVVLEERRHDRVGEDALGVGNDEAQLRLGVAASNPVKRRAELAVEFLGLQTGDLVTRKTITERTRQKYFLAAIRIAGSTGQRFGQGIIDDVVLDRLLRVRASSQET